MLYHASEQIGRCPVSNTNKTTGGPIDGKITENLQAKVTANIQHAIANGGLYVLGYVPNQTIRNRLLQRKDTNHTTEALAWRLRRLFCTEDPSQSQRLMHEQRQRNDRDVDHNRKQENSDIDRAICNSLTPACPLAEQIQSCKTSS